MLVLKVDDDAYPMTKLVDWDYQEITVQDARACLPSPPQCFGCSPTRNVGTFARYFIEEVGSEKVALRETL